MASKTLLFFSFFLFLEITQILNVNVHSFFSDERRIILYDSWVHQYDTSTLDYKIVPTL
jgi:hypothetical protein